MLETNHHYSHKDKDNLGFAQLVTSSDLNVYFVVTTVSVPEITSYVLLFRSLKIEKEKKTRQ